MLSRREVQGGLAAAALLTAVGRSWGKETLAALRVAIRDSASKFVMPAEVVDDPGAAVMLYAARNESETFQVLLQAADEPIAEVQLRGRPLVKADGAAIPIQAIQMFLVHYTAIKVPSDSTGKTGLWPDALVPLRAPMEVTAAARVVWVRVDIDANVDPGVYTGSIEVIAGGSIARKIKVTVEVFAVTLPEQPTLPFMTGLDWESIYREDGAGLEATAFATQIAPKYYAALRDAGAFPFALADAMPQRLPGDTPRFDFKRFDKRLHEALGHRAHGPIPVPFTLTEPIDPDQFALFSDEWQRQVVEYLRQAAAHLAKAGMLDRAFIYFSEADEPTRAEQVRQIAAFHRLVEEADPRLRMAQTIHAKCFDCDFDELHVLDSPITLWVPNIAFWDGHAVGAERILGIAHVREFASGWTQAFEQQARASGRGVWWYLNAATAILPPPQRQYPSLYIDNDAMAHRVLAWLAWDRGIDAVGHWSATYWRGPGSPWDAVPRGEGGKGTNGDGVLLYPARGAEHATEQPRLDGPAGSIRLECIREGGEDHKLLTLAEARLGRAATRHLTEGVYNDTENFALDPGPMRAARQALLKAITS